MCRREAAPSSAGAASAARLASADRRARRSVSRDRRDLEQRRERKAHADRRRPAGTVRPPGDGLRDRPRERVGVRTRREGKAVGHDLGGLRSHGRRRLPRTSRRCTSGQGHLGSAGTARPRLARQEAVRGLDRPRPGVRRPARHPLRLPQDDPHGARRARLEPGPRRGAGRASGHEHRVGVRPLHDDVDVVGVDRLVRSRRDARSHVRVTDPRDLRARVLPRDEHAVREHEPARRPGRAHAWRCAGDRQGRARTGGSPRATTRAGRRAAVSPASSRRSTSTPRPEASRS